MMLFMEIALKIAKVFGNLLLQFLPDSQKIKSGFLNWLKKVFISLVPDELRQIGQNISEKVRTMKRISAALKRAKEIIIKSVKVLGFVFRQLFCSEVGLIVVCFFVIGFMLYSALGLFGSYKGQITVNVERFQEFNQDNKVEEQYIDALNTNNLRQAYFEYVSYTSYYQMFNLRDMNLETISPFQNILMKAFNLVSAEKMTSEDIFAARKTLEDGSHLYENGLLGLFGFDQRYIYTDANKNPLRYLKAATTVMSSGDGSASLNGYFRDYYNKENVFMLSEQMLSEMNRILYGEFREGESITYPEAFVQPVHFVSDFLRIQDDPESDKVGEPYVYHTKRVTLDDIRDSRSDFYQQEHLEGLIYSRPSKVVYDYAAVEKNVQTIKDHALAMIEDKESEEYKKKLGTRSIFRNLFGNGDSEGQVNVGTVSKYAEYEEEMSYPDGSKTNVSKVTLLYWRVKDSDGGMTCEGEADKEINGENPYNLHMTAFVGYGHTEFVNYFEGPFTELNSDGSVNCSSKIGVNGGAIVNENTILWEYNKYPDRHMQLVPIYDDNGDLQIMGRELFNKQYVQTKRVKPAYRHMSSYYSEFAKFTDIDIAKPGPDGPLEGVQRLFGDDEEEIEGMGADTCGVEDYIEDSKVPFEQKKCSIIRKYTGSHGYAWLRGKFAEGLAKLRGGDAEDAEIEISAQAMYHIINAYEDYLVLTGEYGVVWDYKYFTASQFDKALMATQFIDIYGWRESFVEPFVSGMKYKLPMDAVKMVDSSRSISTEYTPVADVSGYAIKKDNNANINTLGYGWRIKEDSSLSADSIELERVAGEASLQLPVYSDTTAKSQLIDFFESTVLGHITYGPGNFKYHWEGDEVVEKDSFEQSLWELVEDSLNEVIPQVVDDYDESTGWESFNARLAERDYRNKELVWNPDAVVYRPEKDIRNNTTSGLVASNASEMGNFYDKIIGALEKDFTGNLYNGRVTYDTSPNDYLPMEVKSVRDYGLGSVLSYIEGRKVTYNAGVFMEESYNEKKLGEFMKANGLEALFGEWAQGFYPKELLDQYTDMWDNMRDTKIPVEDLEKLAYLILDQQFAINEEEIKEYAELYLAQTSTELENISSTETMSHLLSQRAWKYGEGLQVLGKDYKNNAFVIGGTHNEFGCFSDHEAVCSPKMLGDYPLLFPPDKDDPTKGGYDDHTENNYGGNTKLEVNPGGIVRAYSPFIQESYWGRLEDFFGGWKDDGAAVNFRHSIEFLDPIQYYLTWFDFFEESDDIWSKSLGFLTGEEITYEIETKLTSQLRALRDDTTGNASFAGLYSQENIGEKFANVFMYGTWNQFGNAGTKLGDKYKSDFFSKYGSMIYPLQLIDPTQTHRVYLVEEAVTFLGTFTYTYKDEITTLGQNEFQQITDVVYNDRYYYLSHYGFAVPMYEYEIEVFSDSKGTCDNVNTNSYLVRHWYDITTWFDSDEKINASCKEYEIEGDCEIGEDGEVVCETETHRVVYGMVKKGSNSDNLAIFETPAEIEQMTKSNAVMRDKLFINTKIYSNVNTWFGNDNNAGTKKAFDYESDIGSISCDNPFTGCGSVPSSSFYAKYEKIWDDLSKKSGFRIGKYDDLNKIDGYIVDDLNSDMPSEWQKYNMTPHKLLDSDLTAVKSAIINTYGNVAAYNNRDNSSCYHHDEAGNLCDPDGIGEGHEIDKKINNEILVGLMMAQRASYGNAVPLFRFYKGQSRQILAEEKGAYFEGETFDSWQNRLIVQDEDTLIKAEYITSEKGEYHAYLYDYIANFETYVPYDVKTDYDLMTRGVSAQQAVDVGNTNYLTQTAAYTHEIYNLLDTPAWTETLEKFNSVDRASMAQLIAGIIEVSMDNASERTLRIYNQKIRNTAAEIAKNKVPSLSEEEQEKYIKNGQIKLDGSNEMNVYSALVSTMGTNSQNVKTTVFNASTGNGNEEFKMLYLGSAVIYAQSGSTSITTEKYGTNGYCGSTGAEYSSCFETIKLKIGGDDDGRLNHSDSLRFIVSAYGKLLRKYGDNSKAIAAWLYGESYVDKLVKLHADSGNPDSWTANNDIDAICEAAKCTNVIDFEESGDSMLYDGRVVNDVLSFITSGGIKGGIQTDIVPPSGSSTNSTVGSEAAFSQQVYTKWKSTIDEVAVKYNIDRALLVAIIAKESGGNSLAGMCSGGLSGDGINNENQINNRTCKVHKVEQKNPALGLGQIENIGWGYNGTNRTDYGLSIKILDTRVHDWQTVMAQDGRANPIESLSYSAHLLSNLNKTYNNWLRTLISYGKGPGNAAKIFACADNGEGTLSDCFRNSNTGNTEGNNTIDRFFTYYDSSLTTIPMDFSEWDNISVGGGNGNSNLCNTPLNTSTIPNTTIADTNRWNLVLANRDSKLSSTYKPDGNFTIISNGAEYQFDSKIKEDMENLIKDMEAAGHPLTIVSGYRSYARQEEVYNGHVARLGQVEADKISQPAGASEHQTGLAVDWVSDGASTGLMKKNESGTFYGTGGYNWLVANAHKYGFILRFPDGKESITGIDFEPWHWRYVGITDATAMKNSGKTLEEYLQGANVTSDTDAEADESDESDVEEVTTNDACNNSQSSIDRNNFGTSDLFGDWRNTDKILYARDKFAYQNSGVELFKPYQRLNRDDISLIIMNSTNFNKYNADAVTPDGEEKASDFPDRPFTYNLLDLFTKKQYDNLGGRFGGGSKGWEDMFVGYDWGNAGDGGSGYGLGGAFVITDDQILKIGTSRGGNYAAIDQYGYNTSLARSIPPLYRMNHPTDKAVVNYFFGYTAAYGTTHEGIDYSASSNGGCRVNILAANSGVAIKQQSYGGYGRHVWIDHGNPHNKSFKLSDGKEFEVARVESLYGHLDTWADVISSNPKGIVVSGGQVVGKMGNTGNSKGCHLHFSIRVTARLKGTTAWIRYWVDPEIWVTTQWK